MSVDLVNEIPVIEINAGVVPTGGVTNHNSLSNLDYEHSGHTGFASQNWVSEQGFLKEHQSLAEYAKKNELFSKNYNDLNNKPNIPNVSATAAIGGADAFSTGGAYLLEQSLNNKQNKPLVFSNVIVASSDWESDSTYADYAYKAAIALTGVTAAMMPSVVFAPADAKSGKLCPVTECYDGGVYIYASEAQTAALTIPTIICEVLV